MKVKPLVLAVAAALGAGAAITSAHPATADVNATVATPTTPVAAVTANIGRNYNAGSSVVEDAMRRIKRKMYNVHSGRPRLFGWQEIDGSDPNPEMRILKKVYPADRGWQRTLYRKRSDGTREALMVPEVAKSVQKSSQRIRFGSKALRRVSVTRWITITRYKNQNLSFVNTHFIVRSCGSACLSRWWNHWQNLKYWVAREHDAGFNVVITGDFNRRRVSGGWSPANVHRRARHVKGGGIDHIVAVPRAGWKVNKLRWSNGSFKQGEWWIGIDGHKAHWVKVRFLPN